VKARWKFMAVLAAASVLCALLLLRSDSSEQQALEETRRALRQQEFKIDLTEFNFSASEDLRARASALTTLGHTLRAGGPPDDLNLMMPVGSNSALVVWRQEKLQSYSSEDPRPTLRGTLNESRLELDAACACQSHHHFAPGRENTRRRRVRQ
jgi:hypothetical protein